MSDAIMISLSLADSAAPLWRQLLRAAKVTSTRAVEDPDVSVAVASEVGLDDFLSAVDDDVTATLDRFGIMPSDQGLLAYVELGGEVVELAKLTGADGVKMLMGLCDGALEDLQPFRGERVSFDQLIASDTQTGEEILRKYIGREDDQSE